MNVLFSALHFANFRNYESVVRGLAARGHHVHLIADEPETFGGQALVERLAAEYPSVTWGWAPSPASEPWFPFAQKVRYALDYVRFLDPRYAGMPKLRLRNVERAARIVRWATEGVGAVIIGHRAVSRLLRWLERRMPRSHEIETFLAERNPDVVLLTSLTFSRSFQMEQLKAARALGIPTAACILSWDHLSSKALLHVPPDRTLVWNEVQRSEATELHGLPGGRVVVTGAQCYDQWFERRPGRTREEFCRALGLDPTRRLVLYVCSAMSPVPDPVEPIFVRDWIRALRDSGDPDLREASVLVRPHPERMREWQGVNLGDCPHVVVHGRTPIDGEAKADYFESLYYSDAVVGLCTSVFLEAAIVGRPVLTLLLPAYRMHQDGMAHFRYLLTVGGGLLHTAPDVPAHLAQLAEAMRGRGARDERNRRFLSEFIRPNGLDQAATPAFVDAVESVAAIGHQAPDPEFARPHAATRVIEWLAVRSQHGLGRALMMDAIDQSRAASEGARAQTKEQIEAARAAYRERKAVQKAEAARRREQERQAKARSKRLRAFSLRKQIARVKGSVKSLVGARHP